MLSIFRIVPTYLTTFCCPRRYTIRLTTLLSSSAHVLIQVILLLFSHDIISVFVFFFSIFRIVPTYLTTFCWLRRYTIRLTTLLSSSAHVLIQVIFLLFSPDIVSCLYLLSIFWIVPTYLTTFCWPRRHTIRLTTLLSSSAHVLIQVILLLFSHDIISVFIFAFYLYDRTYLSNNFLLAEKIHDSTNYLASSSAHVLIQVILLLFSHHIVSVFIFVFYL